MSQKNIITQEGFDKLQKELIELKDKGRREAADKIREATEFGDLSENSEYDAAKEAKSQLETRIAYLEEFLAHVSIVEVEHNDSVSLGKKVTILSSLDNKERIINIVGNNEASPFENCFSLASPLGQAIVNKKIGDVVEVYAPTGKYTVTIIDVTIA